MNNFMQIYNQFMGNPIQMLSQRFNLPGNLKSPDEIIQHLLNSGQISQAQLNSVMGMRNNPMIQQLINNKK